MSYCLYWIQNSLNQKVYVGKTCNLQRRWSTHKTIASGGKEKYPGQFSHIHAAMRKYGIQNFSIESLLEFENEQDALTSEIAYIAQLRELGYSPYNVSDGGDGITGVPCTKETRKKLSLAGKGRKLSQEHKQKIRLALTGKPMHVNAKTGLEKANLNRRQSQEQRKKLRHARQPLNTDTQKYCPRCELVKPLDNFYKKKVDTYYSLAYCCKLCESKRSKEKNRQRKIIASSAKF